MTSNQEAEKERELSRYKSMQSNLSLLRSESQRLLQESFMLQMECYVKGLDECLQDYNEMRLKLHTIRMHRSVDEHLCVKKIPVFYRARSFKSKLNFTYDDAIEARRIVNMLEPCIEFSSLLFNDEVSTIQEGINVTKAHLGLL